MSARPHRPRTDFSYVSFGSLVSSVTAIGARPNIRLMEELLARQPTAKEAAVAAVLNYCVTRATEAPDLARGRLESDWAQSNPIWLAVVAGEMRAPHVVPALVRLLRGASQSDTLACLAAAEALGKIGGPALGSVAELAREGEWWQRVWAYASLGWNADPGARELLLAALTEDRLLTDAIAKALADRGDAAAIPALLEALRACHAPFRLEVEEAIRDLHRGRRDRPIDRDWRLRYLWDSRHGDIDFGWPADAIVVREEDGTVPSLLGPPLPVRSLDQILADGGPPYGARVDPDGNPICDCCEARMWVHTGVWVCPGTAMKVAWIQDRWLTRARDEAQLDDLFDLLDMLHDEIEARYDALARGHAFPEGPWDQNEVEATTAIHWAWEGVAWLIERGIDDVQEGGERLRQEATRLVGLAALTTRAKWPDGGSSLN